MDYIETDDEMAVKVKVGSLTSIYTGSTDTDAHPEFHLSYDVTFWSEIRPCNKIDKPLVVYRFTGNVMTWITALRT